MPTKETIARHIVKKLEGWQDMYHIRSSKGNSVHTVSVNHNTGEVKCTCQGFRIKGRGQRCKHTEAFESGSLARMTNSTSADVQQLAHFTKSGNGVYRQDVTRLY